MPCLFCVYSQGRTPAPGTPDTSYMQVVSPRIRAAQTVCCGSFGFLPKTCLKQSCRCISDCPNDFLSVTSCDFPFVDSVSPSTRAEVDACRGVKSPFVNRDEKYSWKYPGRQCQRQAAGCVKDPEKGDWAAQPNEANAPSWSQIAAPVCHAVSLASPS